MKNRLVIAALAGAALASAAQEIGLKDFVLGGDLKAEAERAGLRCNTSQRASETFLFCSKPYDGSYTELSKTVAGVPTKSMYLSGYDNKLGSISIYVQQGSFAMMRAAFTDKYPAMKCEDSVVQNRMGAKFDQTVCEYKTDSAKLTLRRRGSDLTESQVQVITAEYERQSIEDVNRQRSAAKKDI